MPSDDTGFVYSPLSSPGPSSQSRSMSATIDPSSPAATYSHYGPSGDASKHRSNYLTSPTSSSSTSFGGVVSATAMRKFSRYLARLFNVSHMDFQFASWQMIYLFTDPRQVFRNASYRKQTKGQFARDDPAFLVLLGLWLLISASGLTIVLGLPVKSAIKFLLWVVFIDTIAVGVIVAAAMWLLTNTLMRRPRGIPPGGVLRGGRPPAEPLSEVEFGYCFDVHLNAFFPPLIIIHVFQLIFYHRMLSVHIFVEKFVDFFLFPL